MAWVCSCVQGQLKLADFGLARTFGHPVHPMTPKVGLAAASRPGAISICFFSPYARRRTSARPRGFVVVLAVQFVRCGACEFRGHESRATPKTLHLGAAHELCRPMHVQESLFPSIESWSQKFGINRRFRPHLLLGMLHLWIKQAGRCGSGASAMRPKLWRVRPPMLTSGQKIFSSPPAPVSHKA